MYFSRLAIICAGKALSVPEQTQPIHADKKIKIKNSGIFSLELKYNTLNFILANNKNVSERKHWHLKQDISLEFPKKLKLFTLNFNITAWPTARLFENSCKIPV